MRFAIYISRHDTEGLSGRDYYSLFSVTDTAEHKQIRI